jgi:hypothetical protein
MSKKTFASFVIFFYLTTFIFFFSLYQQQKNQRLTQLAGINTDSAIKVSAMIGEHHFALFGYTSPYALVTLSGVGVADQTYADDNGYFVFKNSFSPLSSREACIISQDQFGRLTKEVCLPPFPTNYDIQIGPVILPPTLSLNKNDYWLGDEVILTGQSIPNTSVNLSLFFEEKTLSKLLAETIDFIPTAEAFGLPQLETKTDKNGNFSIALPSSSINKYKLFTRVDYLEKNSSPSRQLTVTILPWWMIIFKIFALAIELIKSRLLEIIILVELIALIYYIIKRHFQPHAIVLREKYAIVKRVKS